MASPPQPQQQDAIVSGVKLARGRGVIAAISEKLGARITLMDDFNEVAALSPR